MASTSSLAGIGQDQFLKLLIAQLQNQDPLEPVDNQAFIKQLATRHSKRTIKAYGGILALFAKFGDMSSIPIRRDIEAFLARPRRNERLGAPSAF